jgi:hypothetical protein
MSLARGTVTRFLEKPGQYKIFLEPTLKNILRCPQSCSFFASDGKTIIHPEPARLFETPIKGPLPEDLNYIP